MSSIDLKPPLPQPAAILQLPTVPATVARPDDPARPSFEALLRGPHGYDLPDHAQSAANFPLDSGAGVRQPGESGIGTEPTRAALGEQSQPAQYDSHVVIGETAVAFQSRAIVGPAAFHHLRDDPARYVFEPEVVIARGAERLSLTPPTLTDMTRLGSLRINLATIAMAIAVQAGSSSTANTTGVVAGYTASRQPFTPTSGSVATASAPLAQNGSPSEVQRPAQGARPTPLQSLSLSNPAFAQLVAAPSEYRVIIRGQSLSESDREQLIGEMNLLLGALGLPFQPIQFVLPEKGA